MTPTATYRLQLQPAFPFAAAEEAVPRLARLGVSHLHLSPVLTTVPGSAHGYDVTDHRTVREELGGEAGLRGLSATARAHGLGLVLDIVPNHMAVPADLRLNRPLWETLRDGPGSSYARWFDVDWEAGGGRILLPVLGEPLHRAAEALTTPGDGTLRCGPHVLPLRPGTAGLPLPRLLDAQHYRLSWWRLARTELNYRRFFTVSGLIGVRVEDPEVFDATHATVLRLLREGVVDGLRVDHPDGLADPETYLRRLQDATGGRWTVVEKILAREETLPESWPVAGTTGYDALHHVDGLFTDPQGYAELVATCQEVVGAPDDLGGTWADTLRRASREVIGDDLATEVDRLTRVASRVCATAPGLRLRDHAPWALRRALCEVLIRLPVYRPYAVPGRPARAVDAEQLETAAEGARTAFTVPEEGDAVEVVRDLALGLLGGEEGDADGRDFAARFAQVASALRAKAVEDTAFYRFTPLLSAAEVGGDPARPAVPPEEFHAYCARMQRAWPEGGTVLSTHDTKRSADVRAALLVLAECPQRWRAALEAAREKAAALPDDGHRPPDAHSEWAAWQTAYGLGAPDAERLTAALRKSAREAGVRTSWTEPDEDYEAALVRFVEGAVCGAPWAVMGELTAELAPHVRATSLGMALVQLMMPGIPEVYWGGERWSPTLVDPDNRRIPAVLGDGEDGGADDDPKVRVTRAALRVRREHPEWFLAGSTYEPLRARGEAAAHCLAFARSGAVVAVATRLSLRLALSGGWSDTTLALPPGVWRDTLRGDDTFEGTVALADLLATGPVALLRRA
ncbi:malto-oligosyltrehalose synthase [Streptomyces sp. RKND-216]|uniref:malto-oligosyltrehalose synthase n=1 Tax=Streptomyces sp. RKND-216 TaxID=2562581 RepID=UPI00109DB31B|nr:malto-oligosyltrehalose synthase [Streptomyces sp. RKND-216]THA23879.1 malto-oligosyltrehalose synthase [Streptomyces sp. RKND-216]